MNIKTIFDNTQRNVQVFTNNNKLNFFFFGCWNQNLQATSDIINNINNENLSQFGVVCGDNVYPTKTNDVKISQLSDIQNGFNVLNIFNGDIYLGLGNHEVDSTEPCRALFDEKENTGKKLFMPNNYYSIDVVYQTTNELLSKIIMIDTNVFESNTCYGTYDVIAETNMLEWLNNELLSCENITPIITGHYPLFFFKYNKDTSTHDFQFNYTTEKLFDILLNYKKPVFYLCADIHNYQHIITSNITQHIVGTGGAQQDKICEVDNVFTLPFSYVDKQQPFIVVKCQQKYGHLLIDIENNIVTGEFKESSITVEIKEKNKTKNKTKNVINDVA